MSERKEIEIIEVTRSETRNGNPMWVLVSAGGDRLFVFDNQLMQQPWDESGYRDWFLAMDAGQIDRWHTHPIVMTVDFAPQYPDIQTISLRFDELPDRMTAPHSALELYAPVIRRALMSWLLEPAVVFDTDTTGVSPELDEIVSIATKELFPQRGESGENTEMPPPAEPFYSLTQPRNPAKLLYKSGKGTCAADIHGIRPEHLERQPSFNEIYYDLYERLNWRHWIIWNADFDVPLLDSVCIRNGRPLIPRRGVWCAMKLLGPLAEDWDFGRGSYRWQKLGAMAEVIGAEFPDAHNAQADVDMTIRIIEWAQERIRE